MGIEHSASVAPDGPAASRSSTADRREAHVTGLRDLDDDALMSRAQDGDKEAFEVLARRYMRLVVVSASRCLADEDAGRDVAQDVFLRLWAGRRRYQARGQFKSFLTTLVLNRCRDVGRRRGLRQQRDASAAGEPPTARDPAEHAMLRQSTRRLDHALAELDASDRELLVMRFGLELSCEDIARDTGRPAGTLRSRIFHTLRKLRTLLEEDP